jgi:hypothetical protein
VFNKSRLSFTSLEPMRPCSAFSNLEKAGTEHIHVFILLSVMDLACTRLDNFFIELVIMYWSRKLLVTDKKIVL